LFYYQLSIACYPIACYPIACYPLWDTTYGRRDIVEIPGGRQDGFLSVARFPPSMVQGLAASVKRVSFGTPRYAGEEERRRKHAWMLANGAKMAWACSAYQSRAVQWCEQEESKQAHRPLRLCSSAVRWPARIPRENAAVKMSREEEEGTSMLLLRPASASVVGYGA
jgi:hypothetical protein